MWRDYQYKQVIYSVANFREIRGTDTLSFNTKLYICAREGELIEHMKEDIKDPNTVYCKACKGNFEKDKDGNITWVKSTKSAADTVEVHERSKSPKAKPKSE